MTNNYSKRRDALQIAATLLSGSAIPDRKNPMALLWEVAEKVEPLLDGNKPPDKVSRDS